MIWIAGHDRPRRRRRSTRTLDCSPFGQQPERDLKSFRICFVAALIQLADHEALGELLFGLLVGDDFGSGAVVLCIDGIDTSLYGGTLFVGQGLESGFSLLTGFSWFGLLAGLIKLRARRRRTRRHRLSTTLAIR